MDNVRLSYKRVGLTYEGTIDDTPFSNYSFAEMVTQVHRVLVPREVAGLVIHRTDRPGLLPIQLEPHLLELLRADPARYIEKFSFAPRVVDLAPEKRKSKLSERITLPTGSLLRVGVDTLADAFGECVYLTYSKQRQRLESPFDGRWITIAHLKMELGAEADMLADWVIVKVTDLLATKAERFYLPRAWNEHGQWITREQLSSLYATFHKEQESCRSKTQAT